MVIDRPGYINGNEEEMRRNEGSFEWKDTLNVRARDLQLKMQSQTDSWEDLPFILNI
jgi:hypothetical protein